MCVEEELRFVERTGCAILAAFRERSVVARLAETKGDAAANTIFTPPAAYLAKWMLAGWWMGSAANGLCLFVVCSIETREKETKQASDAGDKRDRRQVDLRPDFHVSGRR